MTYTQAVPAHARRAVEGGTTYAVWTDRKGQSVRAPVLPSGKCRRTVPRKWIGVYRDHHGKKKKTAPFGDRSVALDAAIRLERHAQAVREGRASGQAPADGSAHLIDHVADYAAHLESAGDGAEHAGRVAASLRRLIARHGLTTPGAVDAERLAAALERDRKAGDPRGGKRAGKPLSLRTRNLWTGGLKAFGRWLLRTRRAAVNPFADLPLANAQLDRRLVRRALPVADFGRLLAAARASSVVAQGFDGPARWALYVVAGYTGLRIGALARLTPESFARTDGVPTAVYSSARLQKNKKAHGVPLPPSVGRELAAWLAARPAGRPVWPGAKTWIDRAAEMLRIDLAAAGIPFAAPDGAVFDFHALRGQFGFMLATSGVPLVAAQQLLDHCTPALTANIYSRFGGELAGEVAKLPPLAGSLGTPLGTEVGGGGEKPAPTVDGRTGRGKKGKGEKA